MVASERCEEHTSADTANMDTPRRGMLVVYNDAYTLGLIGRSSRISAVGDSRDHIRISTEEVCGDTAVDNRT